MTVRCFIRQPDSPSTEKVKTVTSTINSRARCRQAWKLCHCSPRQTPQKKPPRLLHLHHLRVANSRARLPRTSRTSPGHGGTHKNNQQKPGEWQGPRVASTVRRHLVSSPNMAPLRQVVARPASGEVQVSARAPEPKGTCPQCGRTVRGSPVVLRATICRVWCCTDMLQGSRFSIPTSAQKLWKASTYTSPA